MNKTDCYYYETDSDGYETLYGPNGKEITIITEPEDRNFGRDLNPILVELNMLYDELNWWKEAD